MTATPQHRLHRARVQRFFLKHDNPLRLLFGALVMLLGPTGCYDTFTRDDLAELSHEPIVVWTGEDRHYHLDEWTIDEKADVTGTGMTCTSRANTSDHSRINGSEFNGTILKGSIVTIKTSSVQMNTDIVLLLIIVAAVGGLLALIAFPGGPSF